MTAPRLLVLVKGEHRHVFRWRPGSEATLLAALLQAVRDRDCVLEWSDLLPVLVRLRDVLVRGYQAPVVLRAKGEA